MSSLLNVLEDLKSGTVMYGKYKSLMFNAPHIVIFSNKKCPKKDLSEDRWMIFKIKKDKSYEILSDKTEFDNLVIRRNARSIL